MYIYILLSLGTKKIFFLKKMASRVPKFCGLDSNDKWVEDCGEEGCTKKRNILKNDVMLLPSYQCKNWWDFLDILECYENAAECGVRTKCSWCKFYFKSLLGEAWGLTWNSWRTDHGQFFTLVYFSPHDERYGRRPMTVQPRTRHQVMAEEKKAIEEKEEKTLSRFKKIFGKRF